MIRSLIEYFYKTFGLNLMIPHKQGVKTSIGFPIIIIISQSIEHFWLAPGFAQGSGGAEAARKNPLFMALGEFYGLRSLQSGLCKQANVG